MSQLPSSIAIDSPSRRASLPRSLDLTPVSRRPIRLKDDTLRAIESLSPTQTWPHDPDLPCPMASIVIVTFNNLPFTRMCMTSVLANTDYGHFEVIIVDNASTDGTPRYLREVAEHHSHVRVILNDSNRGFAPANNQGLAIARGEILVLLNNDTIVPAEWLSALARHLNDPVIGAVGPVTNRIGNEAEIETSYRTFGEMIDFAQKYTHEHVGQATDIPTLCMFCLALRRDVFEKVGPLDEQFEVGLLEDDDYAQRLRAADFRQVCAEDSFVHHFGQASFGALFETGDHQRILLANQERFERKWGKKWQPYARRPGARYPMAIARSLELIESLVPRGATVLVVSKGDETLLELGDRTASHFPRLPDGRYSGHHPADSEQAIAMLEQEQRNGAQYVLLPATSLWWLEHYADFKACLEGRHQLLSRDDESGALYRLHASSRKENA